MLGVTTSLSRLVIETPHIDCSYIHRTLQTAKIGSLVDIQDSEDPEGLRIFYYLVQDLRVCALPWAPASSVIDFCVVLHLLFDFLALQNQAYLIASLQRIDRTCGMPFTEWLQKFGARCEFFS